MKPSRRLILFLTFSAGASFLTACSVSVNMTAADPSSSVSAQKTSGTPPSPTPSTSPTPAPSSTPSVTPSVTPSPSPNANPGVLTGSSARLIPAGGDDHTCLLDRESGGSPGTALVRCWGDNQHWETGDDPNADDHGGARAPVPGLPSEIHSIMAGDEFTCVLVDEGGTLGKVKCWGNNGSLQLGIGKTYQDLSETNVPSDVLIAANTPLTGVTQIDAGDEQACALAGGEVYCWGRGYQGTLGTGNPSMNDSRFAIKINGISNAVQVSAGLFSGCAVLASGQAKCWGPNDYGLLGSGDGQGVYPMPRLVADYEDMIEVAVGEYHACAIRQDHTVICWGRNGDHELGTGDTIDQSTPVEVPGLDHVISLAANARYTCALKDNGQVYCWGSNPATSDPAWDAGPALISLPSPAVAISAGNGVACFVLDAHNVECIGSSDNGGVWGHSRVVPKEAPWVPSTSSKLTLGQNLGCFVDDAGALQCWGYAPGNGVTDNFATPVPVTGLGGQSGTDSEVREVRIAGGNACAVTVSGKLFCWGGDNNNGQLQDPVTFWDPVPSPRPITGIPGTVSSVSLWPTYACALNNEGRVFCWGTNSEGQLGIDPGLFNGVQTIPQEVFLADEAVQIANSAGTICARLGGTHAGMIQCWGSNGDGLGRSGGQSWVPDFVVGADGATPIADATDLVGSSNQYFSWTASPPPRFCAISNSAPYLRCWGDNTHGELGIDPSGLSSSARAVAPSWALSAKPAEVRLANDSACLRTSDGAIRCWGNNADGMLGNGDPAWASDFTPQNVTLAGPADQLIMSVDIACARVSGTLSCWGNFNYPEKAGGVSPPSSLPGPVEGL